MNSRIDAAEPRARTHASLSVGDVVADRYRIDAVLGEGGMGVVYRAEHLHLRKPHALKVLLPEWASVPEVVSRFEREAIAAGNIQSPHVAAATDFGLLPSGSFFLVMEYVHGRTLRSALEAGAMAPSRALHILRGMMAALHAAHGLGVVHRDMKPENVMLVERDGDPDFVKVLDFGIAKLDSGTGAILTQAGALIGTPEYMSPEQALGQTVDGRSDLYSVGIILFELLTGRCPFGGGLGTLLRQHVAAEGPELPADAMASFDPAIGSILRRLLARDPASRFGSAAEVMAVLDGWSRVRVIPASTAPRAPLGRATRTALVVTAIVVASAAAVIVMASAGTTTQAVPTTTSALAAAPSATVVAASVASPSTSPAPPPPPREASPPASPSSSPIADKPAHRPAVARPASTHEPQKAHSHRLGPGGIYIPPPREWFH